MILFTPPRLTPAQEALETMQQLNTSIVTELVQKATTAFELFWKNDRVTPQEIAKELGTNGQLAFNRFTLLLQAITMLDPTAISSEDFTPTINYSIDDTGTINIE